MKRFKRKVTAGIAVFCVLLFGTVSAFAIDANAVYTDMALLTANVYVCDSVNRTVVLKGVSTWQTDDVAQEIQAAIEYTEIPITHRALYSRDGSPISLQNINELCLDQRAQVLVARNGYGCKVVWFRMQ